MKEMILRRVSPADPLVMTNCAINGIRVSLGTVPIDTETGDVSAAPVLYSSFSIYTQSKVPLWARKAVL